VTPAELVEAVRDAVRAAVDAGELAVEPPEHPLVERPKNREHGDYATNVALQIAKAVGRPPREVAALIAEHLGKHPAIKSVEVAGPGFLNIVLDDAAAGSLAGAIVEAGASYGHTDLLAGQQLNLEFVSANPTGPIHIGGVRWAAVGDSLARLLAATGATVTREYYVNDSGAQVRKFAQSLQAAALGREAPEDGYAGEYVADVARAVLTRTPALLDLPEDEQLEVFERVGLELMVAEIRESLARLGVHFDVFFSERSLHDSGAVLAAVEALRAQGHVFEHEGATWLRTTDFGDDRDRPLIRSNGEPTYFAADAAYYLSKRSRGFEVCVYMLGADHHGYVQRLKTIAACAGDDPAHNIEVLIGQLVAMVKNGEPVRMSKRAGNVVTLDDVLDAIGADAARYALARSSTDSPLTLDVDLLTRKSNDNPVFYVQYAHARISSLLRNAGELGISRGSEYDASLLTHEREGELLGVLGEFPRVVSGAAELREPHRVARYLEELAGTYHRFYDACRVLPQGDDEATGLTVARLWLVEATRVVLANGLDLLGVSAPERM
jgi:arginyl-tRNA synthetase